MYPIYPTQIIWSDEDRCLPGVVPTVIYLDSVGNYFFSAEDVDADPVELGPYLPDEMTVCDSFTQADGFYSNGDAYTSDPIQCEDRPCALGPHPFLRFTA